MKVIVSLYNVAMNKPRRRKGEGGLFPVIHNERQEICASFMLNGKLHRAYGLTEQEALLKKQNLIVKLSVPESERPKPKRSTIGTTQNPTCKQFMERWLTARTGLSEIVRRQYRMNLTNHVMNVIGNKAIRRLNDADIIAVMDSMDIRNIGRTAKAHTLKQLNTMLNYAVKVKMLKQNPCMYVDLPTVKPATRRLDNELIEWRTETFKNIIWELGKPDNPHHDSYTRILLTAMGIRGSELIGLTWDCIDFSKMKDGLITITIQQQMKKEKGGDYYIDMQTKNRHERKIPLQGIFIKAIAMEMKKNRKLAKPMRTSDGREITNLVFIHPDGTPIVYHWHFNDWQAIQRDYFKSEGKTDDEIKALSWRPHYNRHIAASIMAKNHVPLTTAQEILGHLDKEMTEWYTHAYPDEIKEASTRISDEMSGNPWQAFETKPEPEPEPGTSKTFQIGDLPAITIHY